MTVGNPPEQPPATDSAAGSSQNKHAKPRPNHSDRGGQSNVIPTIEEDSPKKSQSDDGVGREPSDTQSARGRQKISRSHEPKNGSSGDSKQGSTDHKKTADEKAHQGHKNKHGSKEPSPVLQDKFETSSWNGHGTHSHIPSKDTWTGDNKNPFSGSNGDGGSGGRAENTGWVNAAVDWDQGGFAEWNAGDKIDWNQMTSTGWDGENDATSERNGGAASANNVYDGTNDGSGGNGKGNQKGKGKANDSDDKNDKRSQHDSPRDSAASKRSLPGGWVSPPVSLHSFPLGSTRPSPDNVGGHYIGSNHGSTGKAPSVTDNNGGNSGQGDTNTQGGGPSWHDPAAAQTSGGVFDNEQNGSAQGSEKKERNQSYW